MPTHHLPSARQLPRSYRLLTRPRLDRPVLNSAHASGRTYHGGSEPESEGPVSARHSVNRGARFWRLGENETVVRWWASHPKPRGPFDLPSAYSRLFVLEHTEKGEIARKKHMPEQQVINKLRDGALAPCSWAGHLQSEWQGAGCSTQGRQPPSTLAPLSIVLLPVTEEV